MKQSHKNSLPIVIAGLLLGILMASMDNTIVATAMGNIVGELGGMDKFVWVTSAYMVAEMAGMPIFGKLSDMYGRKKFFIFGMIVFMLGSALCGTATSITELAIYRAIQGIGGGALVPIAFTIMFDAVPLEKRGSLGGLFGAVFGLSSIFGPLLGAYITDHIAWEWIFYINLPLGIIAFIMVLLFYKESHEHSKQRIDWMGAFTLVGAVVCLMFALELGGKQFAWDSSVIISLFAGFMLLLVAFLLTERKVAEPIISYALFKKRLYTTSVLCAFFSGAAFIVASVYIPIFIQGVLGGSATNSGMVLLPMMVGSVVTATLGGFLMNKIPYRNVMVPTLIIFAIGTALVVTLTADSSRFIVTIFMILIGLGIGGSFSVLGNAAIHGLSYRQRGTASSTLNFFRSLGMTIGITTFGLIQSHMFTNKMTNQLLGGGGSDQLPKGIDLKDPHALLSPATRALFPSDLLSRISDMLSSSIVYTFAWAIVPVLLALLASLFMGRTKLDASAEPNEYVQ
ncbi:MFS transporter [Paenibacillus baekrokdamisoli]|uniref:MFS transporter n=1 Tax=Paenibacillus baekrokdamisoli TaxID=1712516 RepID=A0A3G9ING4_9BACL|nr:MDR family MFS transporter [Paenibacillus baekrokdamisoli]MBB3072088.1 EmrB/QacA subfamily drug resistance transporter [Paenibacillus baekrokdamisoli]BBH20390.1 MFS transporter [Paenibacillus baekrokdamisoli]